MVSRPTAPWSVLGRPRLRFGRGAAGVFLRPAAAGALRFIGAILTRNAIPAVSRTPVQRDGSCGKFPLQGKRGPDEEVRVDGLLGRGARRSRVAGPSRRTRPDQGPALRRSGASESLRDVESGIRLFRPSRRTDAAAPCRVRRRAVRRVRAPFRPDRRRARSSRRPTPSASRSGRGSSTPTARRSPTPSRAASRSACPASAPCRSRSSRRPDRSR